MSRPQIVNTADKDLACRVFGVGTDKPEVLQALRGMSKFGDLPQAIQAEVHASGLARRVSSLLDLLVRMGLIQTEVSAEVPTAASAADGRPAPASVMVKVGGGRFKLCSTALLEDPCSWEVDQGRWRTVAPDPSRRTRVTNTPEHGQMTWVASALFSPASGGPARAQSGSFCCRIEIHRFVFRSQADVESYWARLQGVCTNKRATTERLSLYPACRASELLMRQGWSVSDLRLEIDADIAKQAKATIMQLAVQSGGQVSVEDCIRSTAVRASADCSKRGARG